MNAPVPAGLDDHFAELEDPRIDRTKHHDLLGILVIALCAIICGADGWVAVESFGHAKVEWRQTFLALPHGILSQRHILADDTFGRVFARLDSQQFERCFRAWMAAAFERTAGQVVALDGKTVRRSHDAAQDKAAIHMVSAWATRNALVLGQLKVGDKSTRQQTAAEITALPVLLPLLTLEGCIVTIDAAASMPRVADGDRPGDPGPGGGLCAGPQGEPGHALPGRGVGPPRGAA